MHGRRVWLLGPKRNMSGFEAKNELVRKTLKEKRVFPCKSLIIKDLNLNPGLLLIPLSQQIQNVNSGPH